MHVETGSRAFRLQREGVALQAKLSEDVGPNHLVTCFHVREVQVVEHVGDQGEPLVHTPKIKPHIT